MADKDLKPRVPEESKETPPGQNETCKINYTATGYGNDHGSIHFGRIDRDGQVTAGVQLQSPDGRHQFSMDNDGPRKGYTTSTSLANFSVKCGVDKELVKEAQDTLCLNAENGNILITANNGKIRLQGTDIELVAVGEGGAKGHIKCTATETFTVHETKKIILDSKSLTKITSTGSINVAANTGLRVYASLIKGVTDACAVKDAKINGKLDVIHNNEAQTSST